LFDNKAETYLSEFFLNVMIGHSRFVHCCGDTKNSRLDEFCEIYPYGIYTDKELYLVLTAN